MLLLNEELSSSSFTLFNLLITFLVVDLFDVPEVSK